MPSRQFPLTEIRPTTRGWATLALVVAAVALAWLFGDRSLNAVAAPGVVALLAALVQVGFASDPTVERLPPGPGYPDDDREVRLDVEGGGTIVDICDQVPEELAATGNDRSVAPPNTVAYEVTDATRGVHTIGPTTVTVRDVFGLLAREVTTGGTDEVLVYPRVYSLAEGGDLSMLLARAHTPEREEFDDLREYVPGDPLRDIHWKSSAKRTDELIVKEFSGREADRAITIAASAADRDVDTMAAATASIATVLLDAGLLVEVTVPGDHLTVGEGHAETATMLEMLARADAGNVDQQRWDEADITVSAANGQTTVAVGATIREFEEWRSGEESTLDAAVAETHRQQAAEVSVA